MRFYSLICLLICFSYAKAQNWPYSVSSVPDSLKKNAHVIVHLDQSELKIEGPDKAQFSNHRIYTVLNEDGKYALGFRESTSRYLSLDDVDIKIYDAAGKQINRYKKKDLTTIGIGEGLIDDGYLSYIGFSTTTFPVTVDIKYEMRYKSTFFPDFYFIGPKEGVVEARYLVKLPAAMTLRYKTQQTSLTPVISENGGEKSFLWSVKNLVPIENEEGAVSAENRYPHVSIVTDQFSYYGYEGDLSSWKNFGDWVNKLYTGLDELPQDRKEFLMNLVKDAPTESEKIKRIYQYMQNNFRYVSIQLGIGGFRPFPASFTDQKKYGDCKGLSNYMKAALKAVGINSHVAIINASYNAEPVDPAFPANDFNHAILCVPGKDTIWLECTSQTAEFGKLGTFTENRNALLVTENGGVLVSTPKSKSSDNLFDRKNIVTIDNDLSAISETSITTSGSFNEMLQSILKASHDDQKKALVYYLGYKLPDDFVLSGDSISKQLTLKLAIRKVHEFNSGDKYFINPRVNKIWNTKLPSAQNRKMDFYFRYPFEQHDTTIVRLNPALTMEVLPREKVITSDYVYYSSRSWFNEKEKAVYTATTLVLKAHHIPAKDFAAVKTQFDEIMQDDSQRIVMKRTETASTEKKTF